MEHRLYRFVGRRIITSACLLSLALGVGAAPPADGETAASALVGWSRLDLVGRKYLLGAAHSSLQRWPATAAGVPEMIQVSTSLSFLGATWDRRAIYQQRPAPTVWRSLELVPGKKARLLEARVDGCLAVTRFNIPAGNAGKDPARWSAQKTTRKRWLDAADSAATPAPSVFEPYALLAHLERLLDPAVERIGLAGKEGVTWVAVHRGEQRTLTLDLDDPLAHRSRAVTLRLQRVRLEPASVSANSGETVLSLVGPTSLWIDIASGALVELEGTHAERGKIKLTLGGASTAPLRPIEVRWPATPAGDAGCEASRSR